MTRKLLSNRERTAEPLYTPPPALSHKIETLIRVVAVILLLSAAMAAEAKSYSFISKASGRLGKPIRFEFYGDSTKHLKTDIKSFTVSIRTADDRWKSMWAILS